MLANKIGTLLVSLVSPTTPELPPLPDAIPMTRTKTDLGLLIQRPSSLMSMCLFEDGPEKPAAVKSEPKVTDFYKRVGAVEEQMATTDKALGLTVNGAARTAKSSPVDAPTLDGWITVRDAMHKEIAKAEKAAEGGKVSVSELMAQLEPAAAVIAANSQVYTKLAQSKNEKIAPAPGGVGPVGGGSFGTMAQPFTFQDAIQREAWDATFKLLNGDLHKPGVDESTLTGPERLLRSLVPKDALTDPKATRESMLQWRAEMGAKGKAAAQPGAKHSPPPAPKSNTEKKP